MSQQNTGLGIWLMIGTTLVFAVQDALSKHLAAEYNVFMVTMIRYWFFAAFVVAIASRQQGGLRAVAKTDQPVLQIVRGVLLALEICVMVSAFDDSRRVIYVQLARRKIIEKEQRLSALTNQVVDAHRDQIDTDAADFARVGGNAQLGPDAIGCGDKNGIVIPGSLEIEQRAKPAQTGHCAGPRRSGGRRLDPIDKRIACIDVDAGFGISQAVLGHVITPSVPGLRYPMRQMVSTGGARRRLTTCARTTIEGSGRACSSIG